MKLALLLPGIAPDIRWFIGAMKADVVVLNDLTPWSRKSRVHRYQIRTPQGTQWLNVPVVKSDHAPLHDTIIEPSSNWASEHLRTLQMNYRNSLYFDFLEAEVESALLHAGQSYNLVDACMTMLDIWSKLLEMDVHFTMASQIPDWDPDPDLFATRLGADTLILEHNSRHYQRQPVKVPLMEMPHPEYRQHFGGFFPECGILDYIFSKGPRKMTADL
jgi:hypothetical protein